MGAQTPSERLAHAWRSAAEAAASRPAPAYPVGVGWATVEMDRAIVELANALGLPVDTGAFRVAPRSIALGCACRVAAGSLSGGGLLLVLEPDTEGRLAESLARHGEGPAAIWLEPEARANVREAPRAPEFTVPAGWPGPLGRERLVTRDSAEGMLLLLVERPAGTIRP